jgi:predicted NAD/FAD-binding protein
MKKSNFSKIAVIGTGYVGLTVGKNISRSY